MARTPFGLMDTEEVAGTADPLDEQEQSLSVLDDLEEWINQKRSELELGPLKSRTPLPTVGE